MEPVDYTNTFITVAPDSLATEATVPQPKGGVPTIASAMHALVAENPYRYRSSDVLFIVWADRQGIAESDRTEAWRTFYSRSHACLRSSDLGKRYGWGIHANDEGFIALYAVDSPEYQQFAAGHSPIDDTPITVRPAMRSKRQSS